MFQLIGESHLYQETDKSCPSAWEFWQNTGHDLAIAYRLNYIDERLRDLSKFDLIVPSPPEQIGWWQHLTVDSNLVDVAVEGLSLVDTFFSLEQFYFDANNIYILSNQPDRTLTFVATLELFPAVITSTEVLVYLPLSFASANVTSLSIGGTLWANPSQSSHVITIERSPTLEIFYDSVCTATLNIDWNFLADGACSIFFFPALDGEFVYFEYLNRVFSPSFDSLPKIGTFYHNLEFSKAICYLGNTLLPSASFPEIRRSFPIASNSVDLIYQKPAT